MMIDSTKIVPELRAFLKRVETVRPYEIDYIASMAEITVGIVEQNQRTKNLVKSLKASRTRGYNEAKRDHHRFLRTWRLGAKAREAGKPRIAPSTMDEKSKETWLAAYDSMDNIVKDQEADRV